MVFLSFGISQYQKIARFGFFLTSIVGIGYLLYLTSGIDFIVTYVRRAFFIGELLSRQYVDYFAGNFTFYEHTKVASLLGFDSIYRGNGTITNWFGLNVIGSGTNASVGAFIEGYFSLGILGILLTCIIFGFMIYIVKNSKIEPKFVGVTSIACYVFFMSQIELAFITNGLWFFVILVLYVYPRSSRNKTKEKVEEHTIREDS
jgi:hypothetical protein